MDGDSLPKHIAIIMDGNGRWARQRNLPRTQGHIEGVKRIEEVVRMASDMGIKVLTIYAFSTENWNRPEDEVSMLMQTLIVALEKKAQDLNKSAVRLKFLGKREGIPNIVLNAMDQAEALTKSNAGMVLNVAFNYGSRQEILEAVRKIAAEVKDDRLPVNRIDENLFSESLYTKGLPDPDLLIRTSGEQRISNFLLWQLSYAELYFTEKFWPEFTKSEFQKAIDDFKGRERRYGNIGTKV